ncbi:hypothetical protein IGI04_019628 [Brassica rapa subsp. trilocularis]|uniref:Uncharacterized protein n=1 Tax=Brassica rapa subsp. trilocularis TaxID=1813537 RepID=A0ABQ7MJR5_BRACM|nr:hypothetical protein IGI04_019628 [Brassica rapa subsp. trilocularis]
MIIRSHEGPDARSNREYIGNMLCGYSVDHGVESGELYTIFSASLLSQVTSLKQRESKCNLFFFLLFQLSSSDYYKCVAYNACSPHNNSLNRSVEKLLFLEIKTSNVLIGMVNTGAVRCTVYDESYQMEKILDFFGKNMFSLIQNLTESNILQAIVTTTPSSLARTSTSLFDDYFVAKDLNLKPLVQNPPQAKKYKNFMENC